MSLRATGLTLAVADRVLVRALNLTIEPGQFWAVLGPNGCGKTTLMHTLAGLRAPDGGSVTIDASRNGDRAPAAGVLLQSEPVPFWGSVYDYVLLGRFPHASSWFSWQRADADAARAALAVMDLEPLANRALAALSGGERQRARIAQLLAQAPRYYLLDEPLQHLDLHHQSAVLAHFARRAAAGGDGVLMVLHDTLWPGRCCTHALLLGARGQALAGRADAVLTLDNLEQLYGCKLRLLRDGDMQVVVPDV